MRELCGSLTFCDCIRGAGFTSNAGGLQVALAGHPRWRDAELQRLAAAEGFAASIGVAYERRGERLLESLTGSFALALLDDVNRLGLLACDPFGIEPLFHRSSAAEARFASRADGVTEGGGEATEMDPAALLAYLHFHCVPGPLAITRGVSRLLPGHRLLLRAGHAPDIQCFAAPDWRPGERHRRSDVGPEILPALRASVADALDGAAHPAAFLSGGTDSSTIAGLLAEREPNAEAYAIGFAAEGYDEMSYARTAASHFRLRLNERYVTPEDVVEAVPRVAAHFDQPFGNASAVPAMICADTARANGVDRMLAGDGGDELFGGNSRYAQQQLLAWYACIPRALRRTLLEPVLDREAVKRLPLFGKLGRYVARAREPLPERLEGHNLLWHLGPAQMLSPGVLEAADPDQPFALLREAWSAVRADSVLNRMLGLDLRFTLADSDLPKVRGACAAAGVGVAFPMLDSRVVDIATRMPPGDKVHRGKLRVGYKRALAGFLPEAVIRKRKQGFGLPFGVWLVEHPGLRALAGDSLGALKRREIIRPEIIDRLLNELHPQHPAYYGVMVWVLMMLEQWIESREQTRAGHVLAGSVAGVSG